MSQDEHQSPIEELAGRRFSFYPAIRGVEHNEWSVLESTWSEVRVRNAQSGQEFWVPRSHLGSLSSTDSPVAILGLRRELEFKAGGVYPFRKVVTEMPSSPAGRAPRAAAAKPPKQRLLSGSDLRIVRLLGIAIGAALLATALVFLLAADGLHNPLDRIFKPDLATTDQRYLGLGSADSYFSVVSRLEQAEAEEWISGEEDELQFQVLRYPARGYIIVLMGGTRADMRYLGTVHDRSRRILDSARLARGGDTAPMIRNLPEF